MIIIATGTIEEVTRLAGQAVCVAPTVCAWCWAGQTHTPAPVLIGALGAMPATLMSETIKEKLSSKLKSNTIQSLMSNPFFETRPGLCVVYQSKTDSHTRRYI